jgi:hypothetical protein
MTTTHATGGVIGGLLGIIGVGLLRHYHVSSIDDTEATAVGVAAAAGGVALAHAVWNIGLGPIFRRIAHGPTTPPPAG